MTFVGYKIICGLNWVTSISFLKIQWKDENICTSEF